MAVYRRLTCPRWPSRHKPEDGFTLVEVLIAMGVIFSALLVMAFTMLGAFRSVSFSRQRTQATALANQALEQIRALPATALYMSAADTSVDSLLVPAGCLAVVPTTCTFGSPPRPVPVANFGANPPTTPPLVPNHVQPPMTIAGTATTYIIKSYLTIDTSDSTGQTRIATIQVSWTSPGQGGLPPNVKVESKIHTSPFTPPITNVNATATDTAGVISVKGTVLNSTLADVHFNLPLANAYMNGAAPHTNVGGGSDGTQTSVSAGTGGAGVSALATPPYTAVSTAPLFGHATSLDGNPTDGPNYAAAQPAFLPGAITGSGGSGLSLFSSSLSGAVTAGAATDAGAVAANRAIGGSPSVPAGQTVPNASNNVGYGKAEATQSGAISSNLTLSPLLNNVPLVNAVPLGSGGPDTATVAEAASGPTHTYTAAGDKYFGQLDVLPSGLIGLVAPVIRLTGFHTWASACATGAGGTCPASTAGESGTLNVLGIPFDLATLPIGPIIGLPAIPSVNLGIASLTIGVTATKGSTTQATPGSASVSSPLTIDVTLRILGLLDITVHVDLGSISTTANYS